MTDNSFRQLVIPVDTQAVQESSTIDWGAWKSKDLYKFPKMLKLGTLLLELTWYYEAANFSAECLQVLNYPLKIQIINASSAAG